MTSEPPPPVINQAAIKKHLVYGTIIDKTTALKCKAPPLSERMKKFRTPHLLSQPLPQQQSQIEETTPPLQKSPLLIKKSNTVTIKKPEKLDLATSANLKRKHKEDLEQLRALEALGSFKKIRKITAEQQIHDTNPSPRKIPIVAPNPSVTDAAPQKVQAPQHILTSKPVLNAAPKQKPDKPPAGKALTAPSRVVSQQKMHSVLQPDKIAATTGSAAPKQQIHNIKQSATSISKQSATSSKLAISRLAVSSKASSKQAVSTILAPKQPQSTIQSKTVGKPAIAKPPLRLPVKSPQKPISTLPQASVKKNVASKLPSHKIAAPKTGPGLSSLPKKVVAKPPGTGVSAPVQQIPMAKKLTAHKAEPAWAALTQDLDSVEREALLWEIPEARKALIRALLPTRRSLRQELDDDEVEVASVSQIRQEELRSAMIGRKEDEEEAAAEAKRERKIKQRKLSGQISKK